MGISNEELGAHDFQLSGPAVTRWYKVEEEEEAPSGVGNPYGGRSKSGLALLVWPLGCRLGPPFSQDGVSTLSEPPRRERAGSQRRKGGDASLAQPRN